ncbi:MAG: hypothetical protein KDE19_04445, partial [Caldilineaceae bacterium]|nr:hypothetical protein [Caldilineaceae bacterium]
FLTGCEPQVLRAQATCYKAQIDRKMNVDLRFTPPAGPTITGAMSYAFWSHRLIRITAKVVGDRGQLTVLNPLLPHLFHLLIINGANGRRFERCPGESTYHYQLRAFVDAVRQGTSPSSGLDDALANMRVIDAIYRAAGLEPRIPL